MPLPTSGGKMERVREEVIGAYNFLFYQLDQDEWYVLGLSQFDKTGLGNSFPEAESLQSEGVPTVIPLSSPEQGVDLEDPPHAGPIGYKLYLTWLHKGSGGELVGDGVKFTLYHEGTGFIEFGRYRLPAGLYINWLECVEPREIERPIDERDLGRLRHGVDQVRQVYQAAWPPSFRQPYQPA